MMPTHQGPRSAAVTPTQIADVSVVTHVSHADSRGVFTEVFREEWPIEFAPLQWNIVRSRAGVLRGVHSHVYHADYLMVLQGAMLLQLKDMRRKSATFGKIETHELSADTMQAVFIPPGVAHGFYFPVESMHLYSMSHYWSPSEDFGCRWNDPELGMTWPVTAPSLSVRDAEAGTYNALMARLESRWLENE